jgi:hypothetical protein
VSIVLTAVLIVCLLNIVVMLVGARRARSRKTIT